MPKRHTVVYITFGISPYVATVVVDRIFSGIAAVMGDFLRERGHRLGLE